MKKNFKKDFKEIINIKNKSDIKKFSIDKPIFNNNYLFHYLIMFDNLDALKLETFPVYIENNDNLNGFHLAAKENNMDILKYMIKSYPDYIYNRNSNKETFAHYLELEQFSTLMNLYNDLDWEDLIVPSILKNIIYNLNYTELNRFTDVYNIKPSYTNQYLIGVMYNENIKTKEKIKILDKYTDNELDTKNNLNGGLIFAPMNTDDMELFDYILERHISTDYYTWATEHPLREAMKLDIMRNEYKYSKKILDHVKNIDYKAIDKYGDNILHTLFYTRIARNKQTIKDINIKPDLMILNMMKDQQSLSDVYNMVNIDKITPLELLVELDFDTYSPYIIKNNITINNNIMKNLVKEYNNDWIKLYKSLVTNVSNSDRIDFIEEKYSHATLFQATFKDAGIFMIYLKDTYKDIYIPTMKTYLLDDVTFEDSFPFVDNIIAKKPLFPWIICYNSKDEYYIHPYLNNIINSKRHENKERYIVVFLSILTERITHANILIYDLKNLTIERFEPYGNNTMIHDIDNVLEEELTWPTGMVYIRPSDYMPVAGFQTISDENNLGNIKAGDYGGFCLAWCLWYVESRMKNQSIMQKDLVSKLITRILGLDIKFSEYIRNYANKINEKRIKYLKKINIDMKEISNIHNTHDIDIKITNFLISKFHQN